MFDGAQTCHGDSLYNRHSRRHFHQPKATASLTPTCQERPVEIELVGTR